MTGPALASPHAALPGLVVAAGDRAELYGFLEVHEILGGCTPAEADGRGELGPLRDPRPTNEDGA